MDIRTFDYWAFLPVFFAISCVTVLVIRPLAIRIGLVDHPGGRKIHRSPVPLVGGLAIYLSLLCAVLYLEIPFNLVPGLFIGATLFLLLGFVDDLRQIPAKPRFFLQCLTVIVACYLDDNFVRSFGNLLSHYEIQLGLLALPFTAIAVTGIVNAINMLDGIDGQAGLLNIIILFSFFSLTVNANMPVEVCIIVLLVASICAYLVFNLRRRYKVFLGDAGSMMLGFMLAWFTIRLSQGAQNTVNPVTMLWILGLPISDTLTVMIKRKLAGQRVFAAGRDHIHHTLLKLGNSEQTTRNWVILLALAYCVTGIYMEKLGLPQYVCFYVFVTSFCLYLRINFKLSNMVSSETT